MRLMMDRAYRFGVLAQFARLISQAASSVEQCEVGFDVAAALEHPVVTRENDVVVVLAPAVRQALHHQVPVEPVVRMHLPQ